MTRARIRDLGIQIGTLPTGPYNAITDVPGVLVGYSTVISDEPLAARTGITVILPREGAIGHDYAFAGFHSFNGCGEMTGIHWLEETGMLTSAIALTNTLQLGMVHDAMTEISFTESKYGGFYLPIAAETYDGWLNDMRGQALRSENVVEAFHSAQSGVIEEGNVGGGTGMISHEFKAGTGTSSRIVVTPVGQFVVGALVQANHGDRDMLAINGVPVGRELGFDQVPSPWVEPPSSSSILVVLATDAPLLPDQCRRIAQRATIGIAHCGGYGSNSSGDLFLAFSTGIHIPARTEQLIPGVELMPNSLINPFFVAAAEAVEESILNSLGSAETMTGAEGHTAYALPLERLPGIMKKYGRPIS